MDHKLTTSELWVDYEIMDGKSMWINYIHHVIMFNVNVCDNLPPCDNQIFLCNQNLICSIFFNTFFHSLLQKHIISTRPIKNAPIWIGVKNTILSIWTCLTWLGWFFFLLIAIGLFDWSFWLLDSGPFD